LGSSEQPIKSREKKITNNENLLIMVVNTAVSVKISAAKIINLDESKNSDGRGAWVQHKEWSTLQKPVC